MKDYKRLTGEKGRVCDAEYCENDDCLKCAAQINYERLAELEDKIESGELISPNDVGNNEIEFFVKHNKEVRKETAREIIKEMIDRLHNNEMCDLGDYKSLIGFLKIKYGVDLEDEV